MQLRQLISGLLLSCLWLSPLSVYAAVPVEYTNDNIWSSQHDIPLSWESDGAGGYSGVTKTGKTFWQQPVANDQSVRLHRFGIDRAFFYVSRIGLIQAQSDLEALSIYLSRTDQSVLL